MKRHALTAAILCGLSMITSAAQGQERRTIEEVVVTATKRESTIQDVPFSINAQTQEDIIRSGASSLEDVARNVAGLTIQNLGPGQSQVAIRGVSAGQIVRDQPGVKEQVGVYLDESIISLSLFTPDFDLFDLNRVETLRGPQGTLFGAGSIGGTIRYITNQPELDVTDGVVELDLNTVADGDLGGHGKGMFNLPLGDTAALRVVAYHEEFGGFIDARREGGGVDEDVNGGSRSGARVALRFEPSETLIVTPRLIYQEIEADGFNRQEAFSLFANPFTTTRPAIQLGEREQFLLLEEAFEDETLLADLSVEWSVGDFDITSITSYIERDILVSRDASALSGSVSVDLGFPEAAVLLPSNLRDTTDLEQFTQEIRLASNYDGDVNWVGGIFYSDVERVYRQRLPTPGYDAFTDSVLGAGTSAAVANGFPANSPFNSDLPYDIEQAAVFGEVNWNISERATLTLGARYYDFKEERIITTGGLFAAGDTGVVDKTSSDGVTPRVLLSYEATDSITLNAQASEGFRLGGVNDPLNTALCNPEDLVQFGDFQSYDDETLWNYEFGFKSRFANGVTFNAAAFYADIEDLQVTLDAGSCSSRISFNVPEAHTAGVEFELAAQLGEGWDLSFAGSFLEAEFDSTVRDSTGAVLGGVEEGNRLASVPEVQLAAAATYSFMASWAGEGAEGYLSLSIQHIGERFTQPGDQVFGAGSFVSGLPFGGAVGDEITQLDLELDAFETVNLTAGILRDDWELIGYLTNLTDENADLSFDRERGGRARLGFRTNIPRTVGLTWRLLF